MKSKIKSTLLLVFGILLSLLLVNCNTELPTLNVLVAQDFMRNVTTVKFSESTAITSSLSPYDNVDNTKLTIEGPDASDVYNLTGNKSFVIQSGAIGLLLDPKKKFVDKPFYQIYLHFKKQGYLPRIIPVTFYKEKPDGLVLVNLIKMPVLQNGVQSIVIPNAVAAVQQSGVINALSGLQKEIVITADPDSNANSTIATSTTITIPEFVKMNDAQGNTLAGTLLVTLLSFSEEGSSTAFFPGGLFPEEVILANGSTESGGLFVSAGFAAITMTVKGVPVKSFNGQFIKIRINISKTAVNPENNLPFEAGNTIDVWSYDETLGKWAFQTNGKVQGTADDLYVEFTTNHLCYFNLDFFQDSTAKCDNSSLKVFWSGTNEATSVQCRFEFSYTDGTDAGEWNQLYNTMDEFIYDGKEIVLKNVPRRPIQVEIYNLIEGTKIGTYKFGENSICNGNESITINEPAPVPRQTLTCTYTAKCPQGYDVLPPVGSMVYFKEDGNGFYSLLYTVTTENKNNSEFITDRLVEGKIYNFLTYTGGVLKPQEQTHTITLDAINEFHLDFIMPASICP